MYIDESKPFLSKFMPEEFQEDASKLRFPQEFDANDCHALMISEVFLLLDHRKKQSEEKVEIEEMSPVFMNTYEYTKRFLKFKNRENIRAVRGLFADKTMLHKFEVAQLGNLTPETVDEAKTLIPTLGNKMSDDVLEELLKDIMTKRTFQ